MVVRWQPLPERLGLDPPPVEEWSEDHCKVLYLISCYACASTSADELEGWVRVTPLLVLLFEGIQCGALDFDYSPKAVLLTEGGDMKSTGSGWRSSKCMLRRLNITQEGKSALDDLREAGLVNALKLATEDVQPTTALQVSQRGLQLLKHVPMSVKKVVDSFTLPPEGSSAPRKRLGVQLHKGVFNLLAGSKFIKHSQVMETEDVSYVSSPWLPSSVRQATHQHRGSRSTTKASMTSNAHRAHEAALGGSTIKDDLDETIRLKNVECIVAEWIPFGSNQMVSLNDRLGSQEQCPGGLFSAVVDEHPTHTAFHVPPGLTEVRILDFNVAHYINFEAEINFPEDAGIVQVENIGVHVNADGTCIFGTHLDAIMSRRADDLSIDLLTRVLCDVQDDCNQIMRDLLSVQQRSLLDTVFMGDGNVRTKFNVIFADAIMPSLPADGYMDKGKYENEITQITGPLHACHDLGGEGNIVLVGLEGIVVVGAEVQRHDQMVMLYLSIRVRETFLRTFFVRIFILDDLLRRIRDVVMEYHKNPHSIQKARTMLNQASRDLVQLQEVLMYLGESLDEMPEANAPTDIVGKRLFKVLAIQAAMHDIRARHIDLKKLCDGAESLLLNLRQMTERINTKELEEVFCNIERNTKSLVDASAANERSSASLQIMQVICAGSLAFDIIDRVSGGTLNVVNPSWVNSWITIPIIQHPMLFWFLNMLFFGITSKILLMVMAHVNYTNAHGILTVRLVLNRRVHLENLRSFLRTKTAMVSEATFETMGVVRKRSWTESKEDSHLWGGACPFIEITFDDKHGFLLTATFHIDSKLTNFRDQHVLDQFNRQLKMAGVWDSYDPKEELLIAGPNFAARRLTMLTS